MPSHPLIPPVAEHALHHSHHTSTKAQPITYLLGGLTSCNQKLVLSNSYYTWGGHADHVGILGKLKLLHEISLSARGGETMLWAPSVAWTVL